MRTFRSARRCLATVACLLLAGATTGCATLLRMGAQEAVEAATGDSDGAVRGRPTLPAPMGTPATAAAAAPPVVTSIYELAPRLNFFASLQPRPHSIVSSAFRGPAYGTGCQPVPIGLRQLLPVENGAPAAPFLHFGPLELGLQGPVANLLDPSYLEDIAAGRTVFSVATMMDQGYGCGPSGWLYVRLGRTDPLPIQR